MNPELGTNEYTNTLVDQGNNLGLNLEQYRQPVLNSQTLGGNERAFNVSPGVPSISANGFGAEITSLANGETEIVKEEDALIRETTKEAKKDEGFLRRSKDSLMKAMGLQQTDTEILDQANSFKNEFGTTVNSTSKKLKEVNTKINAIDIRLNEQIKQLEKNSAGMFGGALQDKKDELTRQAASDKADLYIEKLIAQDDYDTARNIADRKVDMVLERQKLNLEKLRFDYEENKELFTKSEQRAFELAQGDRERKLNEESATRKEFEKLKIELARSAAEQGAPQSVKDAIARSVDANQAINAAGRYGGDILDRQYKELQIANLQSEISERNKTIPGTREYNEIQEKIVSLTGGVDPTTGKADPRALLAGVIKSSGAKTDDKLKLTGAVISVAQSFAENNTGRIQGLGLGQGVPNLLLNQKGQDNRLDLATLEGTVESWMTGAAVSDDQAKRIKRDMIPKTGDSDAQVRRKINALTNYMLNYASGNLASQGVQWTPQRLDLFTKPVAIAPDGTEVEIVEE